MPRPIINGSLEPQKKSVKIKHDPNNGTTTTTEFECAGDGMTGLAKSYAENGAAYDLMLNPVRSTLVITETKNIYQDDEEVQETWELFSNQMQADIKTHPNWWGMSLNQRVLVLKNAQRIEDGRDFWVPNISDPGSVFHSGDLSTADHFFQHMIRGKTHYLKPLWTLRVSCNVSNTYQLGVEADGGVGTIYTPAQISTSAPAGRLQSTIQSITEPAGNDYNVFGWLKVSYAEVVAGRNRVNVSNEYVLDDYPSILY
jgi:hypothetical protein